VDRFLLVCAKRSKALPFGGSPGQATLDELSDAVRTALRFAEIQTTIPFSTKAASLWEAEYDRLTAGCPGMDASPTSASPGDHLRADRHEQRGARG
jgi:hypothetical protein